MSQRKYRILKPDEIPLSMWDSASTCICLPPALAEAYVDVIHQRGLEGLASSRPSDDALIGGINQRETDQHFAHKFDGSVSRTLLALLDPLNEVPDASDAFLQVLSGNSISLVDAPCGAGAAFLAFLCGIAELRKHSVLPRVPLNVSLLGGEISDSARDYSLEMLNKVRPFLDSEAIYVNEEFIPWDVTDELSNTALVTKAIQQHPHCSKRLLVVANFSGFLKDQKRKEAEPQIHELLRYLAGEGSVAVWIEPSWNPAISPGGLFGWLTSRVKEKWKRFTRHFSISDKGIDSPVTSEAWFRPPLTPQEKAKVRLAVVSLTLEINK